MVAQSWTSPATAGADQDAGDGRVAEGELHGGGAQRHGVLSQTALIRSARSSSSAGAGA